MFCFLMPHLFSFFIFLAECRRISVDIFLKAAGYLDCAIRHVLPKMPPELRLSLLSLLIYFCYRCHHDTFQSQL